MNLLPEHLFYKEIEAKDFLSNYLNDSAVSISGGKDSLVALDLSIRTGVKKFVFGNTSMTFPKTEEYIKKLEDFYNIEISQVMPPRKFLDLVDDLGYPSQRLRWCCDVYKFGPLTNYVLKNKIKYLITGIRFEESPKRQNYTKIGKNPLIPSTQINPILEWKKNDIWEYINYYNLPYHPLYDKGYERLGCWMCPFQNKKGFERLNKLFPELYNSLINSLHNNIKKFGQVGIRDINDYIKNFAWTKQAFPIRNIVVGLIEYEKKENRTKYLIKCNSFSYFSKLNKNLKLLKEKSYQLYIDKENLSIEIYSNQLDINKILIYCEKQVNCLGCGACRSLCSNNAIEIINKTMCINFLKCNYCLNCLTTNKLRAACIARNYAPIRKKFNIIDLKGNYVQLTKYFSILDNNIGLIKTRKKISEVCSKLEEFFISVLHEPPKSFKINGIYVFSTQKFIISIKKSKGFTLINLDCIKDEVEGKINTLLNALKN